MNISKERLDKILVVRGIAQTTAKAKALIMAGNIIVNEKKITKAGTFFPPNIKIRLIKKNEGWVSRGGIKLNHVLDELRIDIKNKICTDLGASTGGFTEVLISRGAKHVYSVDVGKGLLSSRLESNKKVTVIDKRNVRYLNLLDINPSIEVITCDLSFISLTKALENILTTFLHNFKIIALIKPQFELEKNKIGKKGIVTDINYRLEAIEKVKKYFSEKKLKVVTILQSPIKGAKGNIEYFIYAKK